RRDDRAPAVLRGAGRGRRIRAGRAASAIHDEPSRPRGRTPAGPFRSRARRGTGPRSEPAHRHPPDCPGGSDAGPWPYRVFGSLFTAFGLTALFLATVGLYGVMAFSVRRRTQEIGIRMAIGAGARDVLGMVLRQGLWQIGIGVALGMAIGLVLGSAL